MSHWKLTLSYDGTPFHGWQIQPGLPTVQGTLRHALHQLTGEDVLPQGSGRTDTGVHALAQVASLTLAADIPAPSLFRALNRILPSSIRILSAEIVPTTFHARHSARRKTYEYRIFEQRPWMKSPQGRRPGLIPAWGAAPGSDSATPKSAEGATQPWQQPTPPAFLLPFQAPYAWEYRWPLNLDLMQQAAATLIGTHDFTSFAATDPDLTQRSNSQNLSSRPERDGFIVTRSGETPVFPAVDGTNSSPNPIKTIHTSTCVRENDLLLYRVTGSGFLHHMVRNIVGTLTDIGRGAIPAGTIPTILAARSRTAAGPTAPPQGLYLVSVDYEDTQPEPNASA